MEETYLMWLARVTLHNTKKAFQLLGRFGTAENVFYAEPEEIRSALGNATKLADTILSQRDPEMLDEWMIELEKRNFLLFLFPPVLSLFAETDLRSAFGDLCERRSAR